VVAFASDRARPGVAAPFASEALPFLPGAYPVSLLDLVRLALRLSAGLRKRQIREESEHYCRKNFAVHRCLLGTLGVLRRYELNTGHCAFDPTLFPSLFRLGDVRACEWLK
jgi:hypothetical protein